MLPVQFCVPQQNWIITCDSILGFEIYVCYVQNKFWFGSAHACLWCRCLCETVTARHNTQTFCRVRLLYNFSLGTSVPSGGLHGGWTFLDFAEKSFELPNYMDKTLVLIWNDMITYFAWFVLEKTFFIVKIMITRYILITNNTGKQSHTVDHQCSWITNILLDCGESDVILNLWLYLCCIIHDDDNWCSRG